MKHPSLTKASMLIVQPIHPVTNEPEGFAQIAVDTFGAGIGQRVLVSGDGAATQRILGAAKDCPIRLAVTAILHDSSVHVQNRSAPKGK